MRRATFAAAAMVLIGTMIPTGAQAEVLLSVDDGDFFYDDAGDGLECVGVSDDPVTGEATRHWHVGLPFLPAAAEAAGGFGCLGGPASWTRTISEGMVGTISGSIRYTWDQNVPGGGLNDVHLMVTDEAGVLFAHTALISGPNPIIPTVTPSLVNSFSIEVGPGTYTISEDVFFGEHTAWLTKLTVEQTPAGGGGY